MNSGKLLKTYLFDGHYFIMESGGYLNFQNLSAAIQTILASRFRGVGSQVRKNKIKFLSSNKISEIQHKKYLASYNSLQSDWLTRADRNGVRSKIFKMNFSISPSQLCSHQACHLLIVNIYCHFQN